MSIGHRAISRPEGLTSFEIIFYSKFLVYMYNLHLYICVYVRVYIY